MSGISTRPGFTEISTEEEIERVVPVVKELAKFNIQLSIDTYRSEVASVLKIRCNDDQ